MLSQHCNKDKNPWLIILVMFLAAFVAVGMLGRLFVQAKVDEPVKVIVYPRETQLVLPAFRGMAAANSARMTANDVLESIPQNDILKKHSFSSIGGFTATVSRARYEQLKSDPGIEVFEEQKLHVLLDDSGPLVNAGMAHSLAYNSISITGSGVGVCVIDTGINYGHAALGGCSQASFLAGTCAKVPGGYNFVSGNNDPYDDHGHGSHVAGIIASTDSDYRGIAPNASIIAIKVCDSAGSCSNTDVISGIDWCVYNASRFNISAISLSLGGSYNFSTYCDNSGIEGASAFRRPIDDAVTHNISVVVASGNSGNTTGISVPACIKNATSVASTTKSDTIASYSNRNNITDLLAPGSSIKSVSYQGGFTTLSGTSMATPHVSGAIALLAQYRKLEKGLNISPEEAFLALNTTGKNITDSGGSGIKFARIDAYAALLFISSTPPAITFVAPTPANNTNSSSSSIFVNISSNELLQNASLEWNNATHIVNYSMNGSGTSWSINHSSSSLGTITYRVWGNDTSGNWGVSETRAIRINNTAPVIDTFFPPTYNVGINEPGNQTFNLTFTDFESDSVTVDWYVNGTLQASAQNMNFTFLGNYSQASQQQNGTYNITAVISDSSLLAQVSWALAVNNTNRIPEWAGLANQSFVEGTWLNFTITATDLDNDSITYFMNNTANFTINSTTGNISSIFSTDGNFSGVFYLSVNASDGLSNISAALVVNITALNDTVPPAAPQSINISALPGGNVMVNWTDVKNESGESYIVYRSGINITTVNGSVINLTSAGRIAEGIQWFIDNTSINNSVYFYAVASVDSKGNLQDGSGWINVSNSYNVTVSDSVMPSSAQNLTLTTSETSVTLTWLNVTSDVQGNPDFFNLTYYIYISALGNANINLGPGVNVTAANLTLAKSVTGSTNSTSISGLSSGLYHFAVTTVDDGGNENSSVFVAGNYGNITVTPTPPVVIQGLGSSGGGGGGGGGGGVGSSASTSKASQFFDSVASGETGVMKINRHAIPFTMVSFTAAASLSNVKIDVEPVNESNVAQKLPAAGVYQYVKVTTTFGAGNISGAGIDFRVPKSWLLESGFASPTSIVLYRQSSGEWSKMGTAFSGEDSDYYYYSAKLPGFSLFAIAAELPKPAVLVPAEEAKAASPPQQAIGETESSPAATAQEKPAPALSESQFRNRMVAFSSAVSSVLLFALIFVQAKKWKEQHELDRYLGRKKAGRGRR